MGIFERGMASSEAGSDKAPETVESIDSLLRVAERDERVAQVLRNFETQLEDLPNQVEIGGGMTQADWNLVRQFGEFAITALAEFGYRTNQDVFDAHFQSMLEE